MRGSTRAAVAAAIAVAALALPAGASGWKFTFQDLTLGGTGTSTVEVRKCKGGPTGFYEYSGNVIDPAVQHTVTARMPALAKFRDFKDVQVTLVANLPPELLAQAISSTTAFYEETETRFKRAKGKLLFRHPSLILFGTEVIPPGTDTVNFTPKKGC